MKSGIYVITNLANGKVYVGSSKDLKSRKSTHWYELRRGEHCNRHLQSAFRLDGEAALQWEVLRYCVLEELLYWEAWFIRFFDSRDMRYGYNLWSAERHECSEETRAKLSASLMGNKRCVGRVPHNKGVPCPEEAKAKLSAAKTGRKQSPEAIAKFVAAMTGHPVSEETRAKISLANKGQIPWTAGLQLSAEHRTKISESQKGRPGRPKTQEEKAKIAAAHTGRVRSAETRAKLSAARKAKPRPPLAADREAARAAKISQTLKGRAKAPEHIANSVAARKAARAARAT